MLVLLGVAAALFACVGGDGAAAYAALIAFAGAHAEPATPLGLGALAAAVAAGRFAAARLVPWSLALPLALGAGPAAWAGARMESAPRGARFAAAGVLAVLAAWIVAKSFRAVDDEIAHPIRPPIAPLAFLAGAAVGLGAGWIGSGGALALVPAMVLLRWATTRIAAGAATLVALAVVFAQLVPLAPAAILPPKTWLAAVAFGALAGAHFGAGRMPVGSMRRAVGLCLALTSATLL